jgi:hypothetical protein
MAAIASCSARQCLLHLETFKATLSVISAKESLRPISPPSRSRVTSLVLPLSGFLDNVLVGSLRLPFFLLYSTTGSPLRFVCIVGYVFWITVLYSTTVSPLRFVCIVGYVFWITVLYSTTVSPLCFVRIVGYSFGVLFIYAFLIATYVVSS